MRKMLLLLGIGSFVLGSPELNAQDSTRTSSFFTENVHRVSASLGTNGISAEASRQIGANRLVNLSAGYRFYQFDFTQDWKKRRVTTSPDISTAIVGVSYDWFPFLEHKSPLVQALKLKAGLQYVFNPVYRFESQLDEEVKWGEVVFTPEEVGTMHTKMTTNKLQPFLAAGYDQFFQEKKYSFGADLGFLYQGKPKVDMEANNMLEPSATAEQEAIVEKNMKSYQLFPYVALKFSVRL